jgi:hypothetical protein
MAKKKPGNKDKNLEEAAAEPEMTEEASEPEMTEDEAMRELQDAIDKMPVRDLLMNMMISLASTAYKKMGLPEETNGKYKDPDQAKQAIDALDSLVQCVSPNLEPKDAESFRQTVANLKMAFVQIKS